MNIWVQLKDGIAFAYVESLDIVENAILLNDSTSWDNVKAKKYDNGEWVEAPYIYFVTQLVDNVVRQINSTPFSSDVTGDIVTINCRVGWVKNEDGSYSKPPVEIL